MLIILLMMLMLMLIAYADDGDILDDILEDVDHPI